MIKTRAKKVLCLSILAYSATLLLQGCPLAIVGAAGGGALIASDRRTFGAQTEDHTIQLKAASQLSHQLPAEAHINIALFNRYALLTGEVASQAVKQKAESIVRNIANVQGVVNELAVQGASSLPSRSNDSYLTAKVKTALVNSPKLSANFLKVVTERGVVYLMGLVTAEEASRAADVASRVPGVLQVVKVFQYIPSHAAANRAAAISAAPTADQNETPTSSAAEVRTGSVSNSSVKSQPLEQQAPAPVKNSSEVKSGNFKN